MTAPSESGSAYLFNADYGIFVGVNADDAVLRIGKPVRVV
jgi:hypothetical protein